MEAFSTHLKNCMLYPETLLSLPGTNPVGVFGAKSKSKWRIGIAVEVEQPVNCITIYDTGGTPSHTLNPESTPLSATTAQIRVRSKGYEEGYNKAEEIARMLNHVGMHASQDDSVVYHNLRRTTDVLFLGRNDKNNYLFTVNFKAQRQPKY